MVFEATVDIGNTAHKDGPYKLALSPTDSRFTENTQFTVNSFGQTLNMHCTKLEYVVHTHTHTHTHLQYVHSTHAIIIL